MTPIPLVKWDFAEDWSLHTSDSNLSGLSLGYQFNEQTAFDLTFGFDIREFRLEEAVGDPYSEGAVRDEAGRLSLGIKHQFSSGFKAGLDIGVFASRDFEVRDSNGETQVDFTVDSSSFALFHLDYDIWQPARK